MTSVEQFLRTVTGLDEQLHAGYYFYFMTKPDHFLPLSKYAYLSLAAILPLLFQAVLLLKDRKEDSGAVLLIGLSFLPALTHLALRMWVDGECGLEQGVSPFVVPILTLAVLGVPVTVKDHYYLKGLGNAVTGLGVVSLTLYFFPLGLIAGVIFVPLKILAQPIPLPRALKWGLVLGLLALCSCYEGLDSLWTTEKCTGHKLWSALQLAIHPALLQLVQLLLLPTKA